MDTPLCFATMCAPSHTAAHTRRRALQLAAASVAVAALRPRAARALRPGAPSKERLLGALREDRTPEEAAADRARAADEKRARLERQRELQADAERRRAAGAAAPPDAPDIESSLRGQYYFPTARKRYLPRVKLAWETLPRARRAAKAAEWAGVREMATGELEGAVLPMRLYASALSGQGLSIGAGFIERMVAEATRYEAALKRLRGAARKGEVAAVVACLGDMGDAIAKYRKLGKLEDADFGIGEVSADAKVGSGFGNNNTALYRRNKSFQQLRGGRDGNRDLQEDEDE